MILLPCKKVNINEKKKRKGSYFVRNLTIVAVKDKILSMNNFIFLKSPNELNMDIAKRVSARRKEQNITQEQLSVKSDVSYGSIKRFERTGEISLSSLIKIAFALGLEDDFDLLFAKKGYASIQEVIDEQ